MDKIRSSTDVLMLSRRLSAGTHKRAMIVFMVKRGADVLLAPPGFRWEDRSRLKKHTLRHPYMFEREDIVIDPGGRLTDPKLEKKPLVQTLRDEGKYAFRLPEAEGNESGSRYAGWTIVVDDREVRRG